MKLKISRLLLGSTLLICAGWSDQDSNTDSTKKHKVNFAGTLTTWQGSTYEVENIALNSKYKQVPLYEMPTVQQEGTNRYQLQTNPKDSLITKIDLDEESILRVPNPDVIWRYTSKDKHADYIQVDITSKSGTKNSYLFPYIEGHKDLTCDQKDAAGPKEMEISLKGVKELKISGFSYRDEKNEQKECSKKSAAKKDMSIE